MTGFQVLPQLDHADLARLTESIKERGVEVAVVVDENGAIIDGHHRAMIADSLGIEYPKQVRSGLSDAEKRLLAVELNLVRRHLTDAQKVRLGRMIEPDIAAIARKRQIDLGRAQEPLAADAAKGGRGPRTSDEIAARVGLGSGSTYERAKRVLKEAEEVDPDLIKEVDAGNATIIDLKRAVAKRKAQAKPTPKTPVDAANASREVERWLKSAHRLVQELRGLSARFGGAAGRGVHGEVLANDLETLAEEFLAFAADIRREHTNEEEHRRGCTAG